MTVRPEDFCNDCGWPEECRSRRACRRRDQHEVRAAALRNDVAIQPSLDRAFATGGPVAEPKGASAPIAIQGGAYEVRGDRLILHFSDVALRSKAR